MYKGFTRKDSLTFHTQVHRDKVETEMGFGTFGKEKEKKVKLRKRFMCEKCAKTFTSDANLQQDKKEKEKKKELSVELYLLLGQQRQPDKHVAKQSHSCEKM